MSDRDSNCCCHRNSNFIIGLIFGALIGAVIAIVIYKNDKSKVFDDLYRKISGFLKNFKTSPRPPRKIVHVPKITKKIIPKRSPKTFIRPKA